MPYITNGYLYITECLKIHGNNIDQIWTKATTQRVVHGQGVCTQGLESFLEKNVSFQFTKAMSVKL